MVKKKKLKKFDIRKKRKELIELKKKKMDEGKGGEEKKDKLEIRLEKETNLYWLRAITGAIGALIGRLLLGLVGWFLLIWMLALWFLTPFLYSFALFRYEYDEEEWNWKNIIKPGIGIYFFLFMIVGTIIHTTTLFL